MKIKPKKKRCIMQITLPKKFEMKNRNYPFVYDENWIANGMFMVNKKAIKDAFKYCVPEESAKFELNRILPQETNSEWIKTDILYDGGELGYLRVFKCHEHNKTICFKDEFVKHFEISLMKGNTERLMDPFISGDGMFVIMPCRNSNTNLD
jgi:hypothetical protein